MLRSCHNNICWILKHYRIVSFIMHCSDQNLLASNYLCFVLVWAIVSIRFSTTNKYLVESFAGDNIVLVSFPNIRKCQSRYFGSSSCVARALAAGASVHLRKWNEMQWNSSSSTLGWLRCSWQRMVVAFPSKKCFGMWESWLCPRLQKEDLDLVIGLVCLQSL